MNCVNATNGKQYCEKHSSTKDRRKMSGNKQRNILSDCCNAKCVIGDVHDNGEQHCTKCKHPCVWKLV